jgi:hypothetical protein
MCGCRKEEGGRSKEERRRKKKEVRRKKGNRKRENRFRDLYILCKTVRRKKGE